MSETLHVLAVYGVAVRVLRRAGILLTGNIATKRVTLSLRGSVNGVFLLAGVRHDETQGSQSPGPRKPG